MFAGPGDRIASKLAATQGSSSALPTPHSALTYWNPTNVLCTAREIDDLSQRLAVASMLSAGASYVDVSHATGASSTTVSRVSKCLNGPAGGYRMVLARIGDEA